MKKIYLFFLIIMASTLVKAQEIDKAAVRLALEHQLGTYPASTLQDIYKAFYQEHFGAEHMIADTAAARNYLNYELLFSAMSPTNHFLVISSNKFCLSLIFSTVVRSCLVSGRVYVIE